MAQEQYDPNIVSALSAARSSAVASGADPYAGNLKDYNAYSFSQGTNLKGTNVPLPSTTSSDASTNAPDATKAATPINHTAAVGDTATTIAQKYGTNVQAIQQANPKIENPSQIQTGSQVVVPPKQPITTSPGPLGDASKAIYGAVSKVPDQNDVGAITAAGNEAVAGLGAVDPMNAQLAPFIANMSAAVQAILAPEPTHQSLQEQYDQLSQDSGLPALNTQLMNMQNIMQGTPDDIRAEITASGGFADESQVQAMASARNNVLLKQYNALAAQQATAENFVNSQMQYAQADQTEQDNQQQFALTKINDATSIQNNMLQLQQQMQSTAQGQYKDIVTQVGYDGLAKITEGNPYQQQLAESSLGLPAGTLSNPDLVGQLATKTQSAQLLSAAKAYFTANGEWPAWYDPTTGGLTGTNADAGGTTTPAGTSDGSTVVGGIDFGNANGVGAYASDVQSEVSGVSRVYNDLQGTDIGTYIQNNAPNSPVTADMISTAAEKNGIDPNILAATLMNESQFGTVGAGAKTMNPGNVGNVDSGATKKMSSWSDGVNAAAQQLARRQVSGGSEGQTNPQVQAYVDAYKAGALTSLSTVPKGIRAQVAEAIGGGSVDGTDASGTDTTQYSPLAANRFTRAASAIVANYIALPQYQLTANGLPYLQRIAAAEQNPGSVSDQDLLDSLTKLNSSGNAISDAQVKIITDGKSLADLNSVYVNKLKNGGVLSDNQRKQIQTIATAVYNNYKAGYQPVYDQAAAQLKASGIPEQFWTIPDLNKLNSTQTGGATGQESETVNTVLSGLGFSYQQALSSVPNGEVGIIRDGQFGHVPSSEVQANDIRI